MSPYWILIQRLSIYYFYEHILVYYAQVIFSNQKAKS